jgi:hypothetical protein
MKIPTWEEVREKKEHIENGNSPVSIGERTFFYTFTELDPLEKFIYDNEPAGDVGIEWREDLRKMIKHCKKGE